jgi:uncharacterized repeat protein (TIGR01451 family)
MLGASARAFALDCGAPAPAVIDGFVTPNPPSQINVQGNCTIRNFPASNPLTSNISYFGQGTDPYLLVFDNVVHTGNMACDIVQGNKIWFANSSSTTVQTKCQNLLIPIEKIDKQNPPGSTATIGVPFTWKLVIPVLFDPASGTVISNQGSLNDLHDITVWDDLNATGVNLTYVSHTAYWAATGAPIAHTFSNVGGQLTFGFAPNIIPAQTQIVVEITAVLDDTPTNTPGTQFVNTAKWEFGRLIDGIFYQPLPGEWGVSPPMTIAAPQLIVTKTGPATLGKTLNLGQWGQFALDVRNTGLTTAWDVTLRDRLPNGPTGGMCATAPEVQSARVFMADGVTPVPGKGPLVAGADFTVTFSPAPTCELTLTGLSAAASIGPGQRLIVNYRTRLDPSSQNGATLTNVAGATQWFNDDDPNPGRVAYNRTLTNGTPGVADFQDAHTVTVALYGTFYEKTVANVTRGTNPAGTASPGDTLRYTLRLQATNVPLDNMRFYDDLGAMNPSAVFVPGSLAIVAGTLPAGADASSTNPSGGTNGAGVLDIRNINVPAFSSVQVQFDMKLAAAITDGTIVTNQADLDGPGNAKLTVSDDPNVNGQADPNVVGDEDPTRVTIQSVASFVVQKISTDIDGDPNLLLPGERLRYTITVRNVGTENVSDATLRDQIPANTTYVAGSTTLNGVAVADGAGGTAPLANGIQLSTPSNPTPGFMPVGVPPTPSNVATIVFDVRVNANVITGYVVSNQAFASSPSGKIVDQPSDDPRTPAVNDPTRNVVGNVPALWAEKSAALQVDNVSPGIVDPGDVLRYTIKIYNNGKVDATHVVLRDVVPANTTYVADSMTLNGLPVRRPDGGVSPLIAGVDVSSSNLTPPLPGAGAGTMSPGESAVLQFDLRVNDGVPPGTLITNQATVASAELPNVLTDGDGNPATGPEPTVVVVGNVQQLKITKVVAVVGGGPAIAGATLEYTVVAQNIGAVPAYKVMLRDDIAVPNPGYLTFVNGSYTMNGSTDGITVAGSLLTADYSTTNGPLQPGRSITLRFRAVLNANLAIGTKVTNTAMVYWNDPQQTASASVSIDVGGIPGVGMLNGRVWYDANFDTIADAAELKLEGWIVELYRNDTLTFSGRTAADGLYRLSGVPPNYNTTDKYELRFRRPGAGPSSAMLGRAHSDYTNGLQRIGDIVVMSGSNLQNLDLPINPNGVVYDSMSRAPIPGATLTLTTSNGGALPSSCFDDPAQQGQVTLGDGYYRFDLNFSGGACPSGGGYLIKVTPPSAAYITGESAIIPPLSNQATAPFSVPSCPRSPDDAVPATTQYCESAPSEFAPPTSVVARSAATNYRLHFLFDGSFVPGTSQIFNNHIPLDLNLDQSVTITKTTPLVNVSRGQLVPYVITLANGIGVNLNDVSVVDRYPAGFRYVAGSARLDGVPNEPVQNGRELVWHGLSVTPDGHHTLMMLLAVGSGVGEGEFTNRAQAMNAFTGRPMSGEASATVRLVPDPDLDCTDVIGKVFDDANRNGIQDADERGIPGVRVATARGLLAVTDQYGRFHITCAVTPRDGRGSNFVLKLDDRTLPSGYRASTNAVQVKRATRGKALEFSFGASIHRVVGLDLADPVFEPSTAEMRDLWRPRLDLLLGELRKGPAVLRLSYLADLEDPRLVEQRLEVVRKQVMDAWKAEPGSYDLSVETEVFWRRDRPPDAAERHARAAGDSHE